MQLSALWYTSDALSFNPIAILQFANNLCSSVLSFVYISHSLERHSLTGTSSNFNSLISTQSTNFYTKKAKTPQERPRLSSLLVLLLSGLIVYGLSAAAKFIPGADGRFVSGTAPTNDETTILGVASDEALLKGSSAHLPNRPRRWSLPVLIFTIVLRLEVFHLVNKQQQCASPGLEVRNDVTEANHKNKSRT